MPIGALSALNPPPKTKTLDIGCGAGRDAIYLSQIGFDVTGIDLAPKAIEIASQRAKEAGVSVVWAIADALELPFPNEAFDLITDRACFHHIPDSDRPRYVREVTRILRPGGVIIIQRSRQKREESLYEITQQCIQTYFPESHFLAGPVLPISIMNNAGGLTGNIVTLRRI